MRGKQEKKANRGMLQKAGAREIEPLSVVHGEAKGSAISMKENGLPRQRCDTGSQ